MKARIGSALLAMVISAAPAAVHTHPHVFVDGAIDFVFAEAAALEKIAVTWLYDPFETLYVLSSLEIDPGTDWRLTDEQRARLLAHESNWADTFDGAARLSQGTQSVALERPQDFAVRLVGNQLEVRFTRALRAPLDMQASPIEVTFYEETFYYAFAIAQDPQFLGAAEGCSAIVEPYDPNKQTAALEQVLLRLGREETPEDINVGRFFTDRIHLTCA